MQLHDMLACRSASCVTSPVRLGCASEAVLWLPACCAAMQRVVGMGLHAILLTPARCLWAIKRRVMHQVRMSAET